MRFIDLQAEICHLNTPTLCYPPLPPPPPIPPRGCPFDFQILRGDKVHVVNGHHTGEVGIVQAVIRKQNRIIVEGVNMVRARVVVFVS